MSAIVSKGVVLSVCLCLLPIAACKKTTTPEQSAAVAMPALKGLDADGTMQVSKNDRCPVCAMSVAKHSKFVSAIALTDGTTYYFCGTGCMLKSWLHPEVFLGQQRSQLERAVVREYFGGKHVDALGAHWVAGSDVVGPMGPALVPLASKADLETFTKRHGAKATFTLNELTDATFKKLTGKEAATGPRSK